MKCTVMDVKILIPHRTEDGTALSHGDIMKRFTEALTGAPDIGPTLDHRIINSGVADVVPQFRFPNLEDLPPNLK